MWGGEAVETSREVRKKMVFVGSLVLIGASPGKSGDVSDLKCGGLDGLQSDSGDGLRASDGTTVCGDTGGRRHNNTGILRGQIGGDRSTCGVDIIELMRGGSPVRVVEMN